MILFWKQDVWYRSVCSIYCYQIYDYLLYVYFGKTTLYIKIPEAIRVQ